MLKSPGTLFRLRVFAERSGGTTICEYNKISYRRKTALQDAL